MVSQSARSLYETPRGNAFTHWPPRRHCVGLRARVRPRPHRLRLRRTGAIPTRRGGFTPRRIVSDRVHPNSGLHCGFRRAMRNFHRHWSTIPPKRCVRNCQLRKLAPWKHPRVTLPWVLSHRLEIIAKWFPRRSKFSQRVERERREEAVVRQEFRGHTLPNVTPLRSPQCHRPFNRSHTHPHWNKAIAG